MHGQDLVVAVILFLGPSVLADGSYNFWNSPYCKLGPDHTMCKYQGTSPKCASKMILRGLKDIDRKYILDAHNIIRSKLALGMEDKLPPAADMRKLKWNQELEIIAQRWLDQCLFQHDKDRRMLDGTRVGQNAFAAYSSSNDEQEIGQAINNSVLQWYKEKSLVNPNNLSPFWYEAPTGHFTALAWAKTTEIGCGFVNFQEDGWYKTMISCNYAPAGNVIGDSMYSSGPACSECPEGTYCNNGLCADLPGGPDVEYSPLENTTTTRTTTTIPPTTTTTTAPTTTTPKTTTPVVLVSTTDTYNVQTPTEVELTKYCELGSYHTMCIFKDLTYGARCGKDVSHSLTVGQRDYILNRHNELRRILANGKENGDLPPAANMKKMVWNDELAMIAARWTDQCRFGHDTDRRTLDGQYVGQNGYYGYSRTENVEDLDKVTESALERWHKEVISPGLNVSQIDNYQSYLGVGLYSQIAWANTEEIGCAATTAKFYSHYRTVIFCNYSPGGNIRGKAIYEVGEPCSKCPANYSCEDGLCVRPNNYQPTRTIFSRSVKK